MTKALSLLAVAGAALVVEGCVGRLDHLNRPPSMTAPGAPRAELPPISQERIALASLFDTT